MSTSICRVCLALDVNVKMYNIENTTLQGIFEKVTSIKLITEDTRPLSVCYVCCSQLRRCYRFSEMSRRAETIFSDLANNGFLAITEHTITMLGLGIPHNLSVAPAEPMTFTFIEDNKIEVKIEANHNDSAYTEDIESKELFKKFDYKRIKDKIIKQESKIKKKKKYYSCGACKKKFSAQNHLNEHIQLTHPDEKPDEIVAESVNEKKYSCNICRKTFSQSGHINLHMRIHTGERPYSCSVCNHSFSIKSSLRRHQRLHTGEMPFNCIICKKRFSQVSNLRKHMKTHPDSKNYACDICDKTFYLHRNLRMHMKLHSDGKLPAGLTCNLCNKVFTMHSQFVIHMRTHTGEKPFVCSQCGRKFSQSSHMYVHMRIHTGEKPYSCDVCSKSFRQSCSLSSHMKTHSGIKTAKDHKCNICHVSYTAKSTLKAHVKRVHENDSPVAKLKLQREIIVKKISKQSQNRSND